MRKQILDHGIGKGDKSRVVDEKTYCAALNEIQFSGVPASQDPAFEKRGGKLTKVYGQREIVPDVKFSGKPIIH